MPVAAEIRLEERGGLALVVPRLLSVGHAGQEKARVETPCFNLGRDPVRERMQIVNGEVDVGLLLQLAHRGHPIGRFFLV